jgi:hypothetical protein
MTEACVLWSTVQVHMKKDFNLKPYHPTFTNEWSHVDMDQCCHMCMAGHLFQILYSAWRFSSPGSEQFSAVPMT